MEVLENIDEENPPPSPSGLFFNMSAFNIASIIALINDFVCLDFLLEPPGNTSVMPSKRVKDAL
jgi:hypothetical protein